MTDTTPKTQPDDFDVLDLQPVTEDRADRLYRIGFLVFFGLALATGCYFKL